MTATYHKWNCRVRRRERVDQPGIPDVRTGKPRGQKRPTRSFGATAVAIWVGNHRGGCYCSNEALRVRVARRRRSLEWWRWRYREGRGSWGLPFRRTPCGRSIWCDWPPNPVWSLASVPWMCRSCLRSSMIFHCCSIPWSTRQSFLFIHSFDFTFTLHLLHFSKSIVYLLSMIMYVYSNTAIYLINLLATIKC